MILAGIVIKVEHFDSSWPPPEITKSIRKRFGKVKATALLHNREICATWGLGLMSSFNLWPERCSESP